MALPTAPLSYPDAAELESWDIRWDLGVDDLNTLTAEAGIDNTTAKRRCLVNWDDKWDLANYLIGQSIIWDDSGTQKLSRLLPQSHPEKPWLRATKVISMDPFGKNGWQEGEEDSEWNGVSTFPDAAIEVLYEVLPYSLLEDADTADELSRYVEYPSGYQEYEADALQLSGAHFKNTADPDGPLFGSQVDGTSVPVGLTIVIPQERFSTMWHRLPFDTVWTTDCPLYDRLFGSAEGDEVPLVGCINKTVMFGRPIGTLKLIKVVPYRTMGINGKRELNLRFDWLYNPIGHNWVRGGRPGNSTGMGWYMASANHTFNTADTVPDFDSLCNARDLATSCFTIGDVP